MNKIDKGKMFIEKFMKREKVENYFKNITESLIYENRFANSQLDEFIDRLVKCNSNNIVLDNKKIIYRARIYEENDATRKFYDYTGEENSFRGYDEKGSMLPPIEKIKSGRCNPQYIKCLYTAESDECAVYEVKPHIGQYVSIAKIEILEDISIFKFDKTMTDNLHTNLINGCDNLTVIEYLIDWFSKPIVDKKEYIVTQYISEKLKENFDGVAFESSLLKKDNNLNYAIFNPEKCKAISSQLIRIEGINISMIKSNDFLSNVVR